MERIDNAARDATLARVTNGGFATDELDIDRILADSFPASDPPPWTLGVRRIDEKDADGPDQPADPPVRRAW